MPPTVENLLEREGGAAYADGYIGSAETMPPGSSGPLVGATGESSFWQHGNRRHVPAPEAHMSDMGVSDPPLERRGRGRRHAVEEDHDVVRGDQVQAEWQSRGRRPFCVQDTVKTGIFQESAEVPAGKALNPEEVKEMVRDLITTVHGMLVFDESRWAEVVVQSHGSHWKLQAFNEQRRSLGRDGPTPKAIADKLAMSPVADLRHFGIRFAGSGQPRQPEPSRRVKGSPLEDNPTLMSPGVHNVLGVDGSRMQKCAGLSNSRRDPEQMTRRYIASGKDHFQSAQVASHGNRGHAADMGFSDGLERGIGHGKRHIDRRDHLLGSTITSDRGGQATQS